MKLHLGCGNDYKEGYVNCDISREVLTDKIVNLEKKLPFKDNSINEVIANHVFEHVQNFIPLMHELHRICKNKAKIKIKTPFFSAWGQYNDPTHVRFFTPFTFNYFQKGNYSHEVSANKDMFEVAKVKINYGIGKSSKFNWIMNPIINFNHAVYCRFFAFIVPSSEIEYELKVLK
jgi:hypothetical protein